MMLTMPSPHNPAQPSTAFVKHRDREFLLRVTARPRNITLKAAGMPEPIPPAGRTAHCAEAVIKLEAGVRIPPLAARHLAAARFRQDADLCGWRKLRKITRDVASRTHKAARGADCVGGIVARNHGAAAEQDAPRMAARERGAARQRHIGHRFL